MRIRTIKPEFFTHEGLFDAERETKLPLRVAFAGLWCAADRSGRFKWEPRRLGIAIIPYDDVDFSRVLDALTTRAFIVKYRVKDAWYGAIPSWERHQVINNRESLSVIPDVSQAEDVDASGTREERVEHACQGEGKGREGEGKEGEPITPPSQPTDGRHHEITQRWGPMYQIAFDMRYMFATKDAGTLKRFLQTNQDSADTILGFASEAWLRSRTDRFAKRCKEAATIHGLCTFYNDIRVELQSPLPLMQPNHKPTGHGPLGLAPMR